MKVKLYQIRLNVSYGDIFGSKFEDENQAECQTKWADAIAFAHSQKLKIKDYPASIESYERWSNIFDQYDCWKGQADALAILSRYPREAYIEQVLEVDC